MLSEIVESDWPERCQGFQAGFACASLLVSPAACWGVGEMRFAEAWLAPVLASPIPSPLCQIDTEGSEL